MIGKENKNKKLEEEKAKVLTKGKENIAYQRSQGQEVEERREWNIFHAKFAR